MSNAQGLDVSKWQGAFDWRGHPDISFAAAKCYEAGAGEDPQFARNWTDMWSTFGGKLVRIAYCFAHPNYSATAQADTFVQLVRDHGLQAGDHFALDLEVTDGCDPEQIRAFAAAFSHRVNKLAPDHRCLSYTYPAFCENGTGWGRWRLWIADYGVPEPAVPAPWKTWAFWQKSGTGTDLDAYHGDRESLLSFALMPADRR